MNNFTRKEKSSKYSKLARLFISMFLILGLAVSILTISGGPRVLTNAIRLDNKYAYYLEIDKNLYKPVLIKMDERAEKYAKKHTDSILINAGLFRILTAEPNGQFIVNYTDYSVNDYMIDDIGAAISDEECYPLIIDNGNLFILSHDRTDYLNSRQNLVNYEGAVCGWGTLFENGQDTDLINKDIRWGKDKKARQIVGTLKNGNYFVLTCEGAYYKTIVEFLKTKDVDFAYSLDGGHSTKFITNGKMHNRFMFNLHGRSFIPSMIEFQPISNNYIRLKI